MIRKIIELLPKNKSISLLKFGARLIVLNILDLISVAYLIPIITLILSKEKFIELLEKYNLNQGWFSERNLIFILLIFIFFYIAKNIIQIKVNKNLLNYLQTLKSSIAENRVKNFINSGYLYHKKQNKGELINIVMQATGHFCSKLLYPFMLLFSELALLIILLIFSFYIQWEFMLLLFFIFVLFGISVYLRKRVSIKTYYYTPKEMKKFMDLHFEYVASGNLASFYPSVNHKLLTKYNWFIKMLIKIDSKMKHIIPTGIGDYFIITFRKK